MERLFVIFISITIFYGCANISIIPARPYIDIEPSEVIGPEEEKYSDIWSWPNIAIFFFFWPNNFWWFDINIWSCRNYAYICTSIENGDRYKNYKESFHDLRNPNTSAFEVILEWSSLSLMASLRLVSATLRNGFICSSGTANKSISKSRRN